MKQKPIRDGNPETDAAIWLKQRWSWFGLLMVGKRSAGNVTIEGFSARFDGVTWWVVVRGLRDEPLAYVCAFGRAERLYAAFRNVTTSIAKGQWSVDRYRHVSV